ncbi:FUSC family protein [Bradyrhizobium sp. Pha-3]|uniref:FUSC family protein n=1 Tax=Bradyrhizobium sp. Pha-3 TaxID=208375 RepID=UPI0035D3F04F
MESIPLPAQVIGLIRQASLGLRQWLPSSLPPVLFALRLWTAAYVALYVAFWLQLDNAYWAATSAVIVSQPTLGASLRKAWFRMVGTMLGAVAIVILTAWFPQNRLGFLLGLALWGASCSFVATILRNFVAYGVALAGVTAAIIASDELGATGGASGHVFLLALTRVSEIWIGIVSASVVMAGTDLGRARRRLTKLLASLSAAVAAGLVRSLAGASGDVMRVSRRDLIQRTIALDPVIDEVMGEAPDLRVGPQGLRAAVEGLFVALSNWRLVANHLDLLPDKQRRSEADAILRELPAVVRSLTLEWNLARWTDDAASLRRVCAGAVRTMVALPAQTSSLRMMADGVAQALIGIARSLDGMMLLADHDQSARTIRAAQFPIADCLPAVINAVRTFLMICAVAAFWIVTAWPGGVLAIVWSTIFVIANSLPGADEPYADAKSRLLGIIAAAVCAAIIKFAVLPGSETFIYLALAIGVVIIPAAALSTQPWQPAMFGFLALGFIPFLKPENPISYDSGQYYNDALAIIAGAGASTLAFRLIPPPSPAFRVARLLRLTLRDLRRLVTRKTTQTRIAWENLVYARLASFPSQSQPLQRARLLAALSIGSEVIKVRRRGRRLGCTMRIEAALEPLGWGDSVIASKRLEELGNTLSAVPDTRTRAVQRVQGSIRAISEGLRQHAAYFGSRTVDELR